MTASEDLRERLLRKLLAERGHALPVGPAVPRRPAGARVPLTSAQERLRALDRLGDSSAYLVPVVLRLTGPLDADRLAAALRAVVRRHEALRTALLDGAQEVRDVEPVLDRHDVAPDGLAAAVDAETGRPFDLAAPPLLRAALFRLAADEHVLTLVAHHAVCDDLSLGIVLRDLATAYGGAALAEPAVQFADYAVWRRDRRTPERVAAQEAYWTRTLAGAPDALDLPTDRPRPPMPSGRGESVPCTLPAGLADRVGALARETGCTPYMVLLAGFAALLARYAGQDEVVIGSPVADRPVAELDDVVGMFVNTVPLRVDLRGAPTVRELLARVKETCVAGFDAADLPLERILELAGPRRRPGRHPLFQVMMVLNPAGSALALPGLRVEPVGLGATPARFELTLLLTDGPGLTGQLDLATDLFDPDTAERMGTQLGALLDGLVADPDRRVDDLPLLAAPTGDLPPAATAPPVTELIAARVAADPGAPAVIAPGEELSYAELAARSDALAAALAAAGVRAETVVGLAAPAGPAAIVGLLAVLKAGGAYLPLDPGHPPDRLAGLLADAGAPVLLSADPGLVPSFPGTVLPLDAAAAGPAGAAPAPDPAGPAGVGPAPTAVTPEPGSPVTIHTGQLAYVVFTSGSTGRPKGVGVPHSALTNLAVAFAERHGFGPGTRLLMVPPLSFDASVGDVFPALVSGAALVLHPDPGSASGPELSAFCRQHGVTVVDTASALWQQWVRDGGDFAGVHTMMVGGESVPTAVVAAWAARTGGTAALYNHYGPTEATVCATTYRTVDGSEVDGPELPAGRPLPGVRVYVLDARMRPVPVGVPGEVHLGGVGVARGYLGRPDLTAAAFGPDPFCAEPGGRLYRTGDRARWGPDGELRFLGRVDRQVKLRGHRVELGEVEAAVTGHPAVREAVVVAERGPDGAANRLVAYVVPAGEPPSLADLRAHCGRTLPAAVLPGALVVLPELPLTRHGKVDAAALPAPAVGADRTGPRTPTEAALAAIWAEVLGVAAVGPQDNFFDLGGHSLRAGPLLSRVRDRWGVDLPLRVLYDTADLAGLAAAVDAGEPAPEAGPDVAQLRADAELPADALPPDLRPAAGRAGPPGRILLTGGTGFLGGYLLAELLERTGADVTCVVRAASAAEGADRLRRGLERWGRWRPEYAARLVALPGDLSRPRLGRSADEWDALAAETDAIYHVAGAVRFQAPYRLLRPDNVGGTVELLRLAGHRRVTPLHYVSSLGVFLGSAHRGRVVRETDPPDDPAGLDGGYGQSKWVADGLVRAAGRRGLPVTVSRPARIAGDSVTGAWTEEDFLVRLVKTFVQLGCAYESAREHDLAPVDHVAAAIAKLSLAPDAPRTLHFHNPRTLSGSELVRVLVDFGYRLDVVSNEDYLDRARRALAAGADLAIAPFVGMRTTVPTGPGAPVFDCSATERAVAAGPPPDPARLMTRYLDHFVRTGYLPAPEAR